MQKIQLDINDIEELSSMVSLSSTMEKEEVGGPVCGWLFTRIADLL